MKKLFSIIFLLAFLYNLAGYYLVFHWERAAARAEMTERIAEEGEGRQVLAFPVSQAKANIAWENSHEFRWQGHLYDLAEKKLDHGTLYLYCYQDDKEESLLAALGDHLVMDNILPEKSSSPAGKNLQKTFEKDYFFEGKRSLVPAAIASTYQYPHVTERGASLHPGPLSPPPRQIA